MNAVLKNIHAVGDDTWRGIYHTEQYLAEEFEMEHHVAVEEVGTVQMTAGIHHEAAEEVGTADMSPGVHHLAVEEVGTEQMLAGDFCVAVEEVGTEQMQAGIHHVAVVEVGTGKTVRIHYIAVEVVDTGKMLAGIQYLAAEVDIHQMGWLTDCLAANCRAMGKNLKKYNKS